MDWIKILVAVFLMTVSSVNAGCGVTSLLKKNEGVIQYQAITTDIESCTWSLTPIYESPIEGMANPNNVPDKKTMLIVTVAAYKKGLGITRLPASTSFDSSDVGNCYRFTTTLDTGCSDTSWKSECATPLKSLSQAEMIMGSGAYQVMSASGLMASFTLNYKFVKCDQTPTTTTSTTMKPTTPTTPKTDPTPDTGRGFCMLQNNVEVGCGEFLEIIRQISASSAELKISSDLHEVDYLLQKEEIDRLQERVSRQSETIASLTSHISTLEENWGRMGMIEEEWKKMEKLQTDLKKEGRSDLEESSGPQKGSGDGDSSGQRGGSSTIMPCFQMTLMSIIATLIFTATFYYN